MSEEIEIVKSVKLTISGKEVEVSMEEARRLAEALDELFSTRTITVPVPTLPPRWEPLTWDFPTWDFPKITC